LPRQFALMLVKLVSRRQGIRSVGFCQIESAPVRCSAHDLMRSNGANCINSPARYRACKFLTRCLSRCSNQMSSMAWFPLKETGLHLPRSAPRKSQEQNKLKSNWIEQNERKPKMNTQPSGTTDTVKDKIVAAIKGAGDIVQTTVDTVAQILGTTIKDTGNVGTAITDGISHVVSGAIRGAVQVGADLGRAAKGIMLGILRGTKEAGAEALDTIRHTAHVAIRDTAEVGGDVEAAATGLVAGAVEGAKELGVSAEDAAAAAAAGALNAAGEIGSAASDAVRKAVTKPINGVKVVLKEPKLTVAA